MSNTNSYRIVSRSTDTIGRTINSARHNQFVIDSPSGPGEALLTGEAFVAGIASCGVTLIQYRARDAGIPVDRLDVEIEGVRLNDNPTDFTHIDVRFEFTGPTPEQADHLVGLWRQQCPLYRSVAKGVPVNVEVVANG